ncbi:MAG TPA: hypothetical protein VJ499_04435, partial [Flavisolibacter sp.]|nr:hypothetical protein [Flavisolibacter sp.]
MKKNFTPENFEDFLRQSADGLRMRPSVKVWKGVSSQLNKRRRRFEFIIGAFIIALSTFGYFIIEQPGSVSKPSSSTAIKAAANQENFAIVDKPKTPTTSVNLNSIAAVNNKNRNATPVHSEAYTSPGTNKQFHEQQIADLNPTE